MIKIGETWYKKDATSKPACNTICAFMFNDEKCKQAPCKDFEYYKEVFEHRGRFYVLEESLNISRLCDGCEFHYPAGCRAIDEAADNLLCNVSQVFKEVFPCGS